MAKYLFRVDDIAEEMSNWDNFEKLCKVFKKYKIKPIIAIIPDNKDPDIKGKKKKGWINLIKDFTVAQHGYQHRKTGNGGIHKLNPYGEFGGLRFYIQMNMIKGGKEILEKKGFKINTFVPPWHSYDRRTIIALHVLKFDYINDSFGLFPYDDWFGTTWIPVNDWKISKKLFGIRTLTMHVQDITKEKIKQIEEFIKQNKQDITSIEELSIWNSDPIWNKLSRPYFWFRYGYYSPLFRVVKWLKRKN